MFNPSRLTEPLPGVTAEVSVLAKGPNGDTRSAGMYLHHCGRSVAIVCDDSVAARLLLERHLALAPPFLQDCQWC